MAEISSLKDELQGIISDLSKTAQSVDPKLMQRLSEEASRFGGSSGSGGTTAPQNTAVKRTVPTTYTPPAVHIGRNGSIHIRSRIDTSTTDSGSGSQPAIGIGIGKEVGKGYGNGEEQKQLAIDFESDVEAAAEAELLRSERLDQVERDLYSIYLSTCFFGLWFSCLQGSTSARVQRGVEIFTGRTTRKLELGGVVVTNAMSFHVCA